MGVHDMKKMCASPCTVPQQVLLVTVVVVRDTKLDHVCKSIAPLLHPGLQPDGQVSHAPWWSLSQQPTMQCQLEEINTHNKMGYVTLQLTCVRKQEHSLPVGPGPPGAIQTGASRGAQHSL